MFCRFISGLLVLGSLSFCEVDIALAQGQPDGSSFAMIDGNGPDWVPLGKDDFVRANCDEDTWVWDGATVHCTGKPIGVLRSAQK